MMKTEPKKSTAGRTNRNPARFWRSEKVLGNARRNHLDKPLVLEDAIHLGGSVIEHRLRWSLAEEDADDGLAECSSELVRFRMEVRRRYRLRKHGFRRRVVGPRLH